MIHRMLILALGPPVTRIGLAYDIGVLAFGFSLRVQWRS
jgi:hypothetical protein